MRYEIAAMIIVSGHLVITPGRRQEFLDSSRPAMIQARSTNGCRDFVVSADPLDENRVNIYEEWESEALLKEFCGSGPSDAMNELISDAKVMQREFN